MMIKRCLVVLFVGIIMCAAVPRVAYAASNLPESVAATEQMNFFPLLYVTILLAAVMLCSFVVSTVFGIKYRKQKELSCHNLSCPNNPAAGEIDEGAFDYRLFETPKELLGVYSSQSDLAVEEAIMRLSEQGAQTQTQTQVQAQVQTQETSATTYVPRHKKEQEQSGNETSPLPIITFVPARAQTQQGSKPTAPADVPEELEYLLRKIS